VPWTNFDNDPPKYSVPFSKFPADYAQLPTVSWVIPDLLDDMHDGSIAQGDTWLKNNLSDYVAWAQANSSLLIVTWDEDDGSQGNHIATIFVGPMVAAGKYSEQINHYHVLRTIEAMYGLKPLGNSAVVKPIRDVWQ
jgi:acid phosphatase